ncbi:SRPBCC family protein [Glycomyces paridis]|nr:SRPBCC domain-containing protein [Glycomyces paridis]
MTETDSIHCEQYIPHPPAKVWAALTVPELHARWWAEGDVKPVV